MPDLSPIEKLAIAAAKNAETLRRYRASAKGKAAAKRFRDSEKGQAYRVEYPFKEVVHESEINYEFKVIVKGILFTITTSGLTYREARNKARREGVNRYLLYNDGSRQELWYSCRASTTFHGRTFPHRAPSKRRIKSPEEQVIAEARAEEAQRRYMTSEKGRAAQDKYQHSDKGRAARARYWASDKGKARYKEWLLRRRILELTIFAETPEGKAYYEEQERKAQRDKALIGVLHERKAILCRLTK